MLALPDPWKGLELKHAGMERVALNNLAFLHKARRQIARILMERDTVSIDDLREWADDNGITPKHPNAWGTVFNGQGLIRFDYVPSRYPSSRGRMIAVWGRE